MKPGLVAFDSSARFNFGGLEVLWKLDGAETGQRFSIVHAGDGPSEIIEIISPAGFEDYFRDVAANRGDLAKFEALNNEYRLERQFDNVADLCRRFGSTFPAI